MSEFPENDEKKKSKVGLTVLELSLFAVLGAITFATKVAMSGIPNVHLVAMFIISFTVVFRWKALIPMYVYIFLEGLFYGFGLWWIPYLYIWAILFGAAMLVPRKWNKWLRGVMYCLIGMLHGFLFGILWAPMQALFFGLNFKGTVAWVMAGLPFDITHGISNLFMCTMVLPVSGLLSYLTRRMRLGKEL